MTVAPADIVVRRMSSADIAAVVDLQVAFLEGSIVTELGSRFLTRLHAAALGHASTRAFVAVDPDQRLAGFIMASTDVHAFNRHVKPKIVVPLALACMTPRGLRIGWSVARSLIEREPRPYIPAELLLLVVGSAFRRRGIGQRLLAAFEEAFRREAIAIYRVAVRSHLEIARRFYRALGFEIEQELAVLGYPMTYLTKRLPS